MWGFKSIIFAANAIFSDDFTREMAALLEISSHVIVVAFDGFSFKE